MANEAGTAYGVNNCEENAESAYGIECLKPNTFSLSNSDMGGDVDYDTFLFDITPLDETDEVYVGDTFEANL